MHFLESIGTFIFGNVARGEARRNAFAGAKMEIITKVTMIRNRCAAFIFTKMCLRCAGLGGRQRSLATKRWRMQFDFL